MVICVQKADASPQAVSAILRGLEPWFGIEEYTQQYIAAANRLPNYLALDDLTGEPVGVILVEHHFPHSAEIHLMAVKAERHRQGIGRLLMSTVERDLWHAGTRLLTVKTLGPSRADMNYEATRRFYEAIGYLPVQEFLDLWPEDPCLLMIKPLSRGLDTPSTFTHTVVSDADTILRPFRDADCSHLADAFADPDILRWNPGPAAEHGETAIRAWMDGRNDWSDGSHASWAISDPSGELLGSVSLHKLDLEQADAEVGYWVAPWARGQGRGAAAVAAAARFGFEELHLHRLHLFHAVENIGSCRVAAAAGFQMEGRLRLSYKLADGQYHDEHLHARLNADPADGRPSRS